MTNEQFVDRIKTIEYYFFLYNNLENRNVWMLPYYQEGLMEAIKRLKDELRYKQPKKFIDWGIE